MENRLFGIASCGLRHAHQIHPECDKSLPRRRETDQCQEQQRQPAHQSSSPYWEGAAAPPLRFPVTTVIFQSVGFWEVSRGP